jgi:membrane-associated protease RseP (regulator of RpoE activity)
MHIEVILLLCLSVSLHELGHAFAMRKYGIQIQEICLLGLGGSKLISFKIRKLFGETPITIRSFILGGFVAPTYFGRLRVYCLEYDKAGHIYGGGIAVNFLFGSFLLLTHSLIEGQIDTKSVWTTCILLALGLLPRYTFRLYPILGLYILFGVFNDLASSSAATVSLTGRGVKSIRSIAMNSDSFSETLYLGGWISVALGIINCIPVLPADGGRIIERMLCSISYKHRKLIIGIYKLAIIPLAIAIFIAVTSKNP